MMGLDLVQLRKGLRKNTGTDESDLPDEDADLYLNRAYWELLDKFPFREKEVTVTFMTEAGKRLYNVPSPFEALRKLSILDPDTQKHDVIDPMTIDEYENEYSPEDSAQDIPTRYVREGCAVRLWPTPDAAYEVTMKYWTVLADLSDINLTSPLPQSFHEVIEYGATWRVFVSHKNYKDAGDAKNLQNMLLLSAVPTEAKEEEDRTRAGVVPLRNDYDV
jgi:hypothetical protein